MYMYIVFQILVNKVLSLCVYLRLTQLQLLHYIYLSIINAIYRKSNNNSR